jgi:hypothetical protein
MHGDAEQRLFERADAQHGFFTAGDAIRAGYADNLHSYHVRNGDWVRVRRGIYRLVRYPDWWWPALMEAWLWTRNRENQPEGVLSHTTALVFHEAERRPHRIIELTVPPNFRRNSTAPSGLRLHRKSLSLDQRAWIDGLPVTSPLRTMADLQEAHGPVALGNDKVPVPKREESVEGEGRGKKGSKVPVPKMKQLSKMTRANDPVTAPQGQNDRSADSEEPVPNEYRPEESSEWGGARAW